MKVLDFAPFPGSYVREFELSHSNLVNRIIKITHAHNLHVKMLVFGLLQFVRKKKGKLSHYKIFSSGFKKSIHVFCWKLFSYLFSAAITLFAFAI